jgi:hypothetical protein
MKKPEHQHKLSLDRETVALMQPDALIGVAGGASACRDR